MPPCRSTAATESPRNSPWSGGTGRRGCDASVRVRRKCIAWSSPARCSADTPMLPLTGIKVVELGANLAGPYAAEVLGHLGADVVKIERPEGDDARQWGPPFHKGVAPSYLAEIGRASCRERGEVGGGVEAVG